jgi:hypothetical protein
VVAAAVLLLRHRDPALISQRPLNRIVSTSLLTDYTNRDISAEHDIVVAVARVTILRRPVAMALGIVLTAVEFFAVIGHPPRLR